MIAKLPFGDDELAVDLRGLRVRRIAGAAPPGPADPGRLAAAALDFPVGGPPLRELAARRGRAVVVVPDGTRPAALPAVLPEVLGRILEKGRDPRSVTVLVACGTHPAMPPEQLSRHLGGLPAGVVVVQHDARDDRGLASVGRVGDGISVRLNRVAVEADLLVTVAAVSHHYFAGFGGGPKMVFPGLGGYGEIQRNHSRVMDLSGGEPRRIASCDAGVLEDNPVAEEIAAAAALRPPDLALCLAPGSDGRPAAAWSGEPRAAFSAAVGTVREWFEIRGEAPARLVLASGGGAPTDRTLIQAHKRFDAAWRWLAPDGELLFVAAMDEGDGSPDMAPFVDDPRPNAIVARLRGQWVQYGHTTLRILEKTASNPVWLASRYPHERASALGFRPVSDPAVVVERWRDEHPGETVAVLTGPPVYPSPPTRR